jgi:hypothetical protein
VEEMAKVFHVTKSVGLLHGGVHVHALHVSDDLVPHSPEGVGLLAMRWEDGSLPSLMICPPMDSMLVLVPHLCLVGKGRRLEEGGMVTKLHFSRVLVT